MFWQQNAITVPVNVQVRLRLLWVDPGGGNAPSEGRPFSSRPAGPGGQSSGLALAIRDSKEEKQKTPNNVELLKMKDVALHQGSPTVSLSPFGRHALAS